MKNFISEIKEKEASYGSIPFWSWNDRLKEGELRRQINNMHKLGMSGFFMHARGGLETEYLSDEWFDDIKYCIDEAKKLGMEAWSYDENGWPSGFAGGELLKDKANFATYLKCEEKDSYPDDMSDVLGVYVKDNNGMAEALPDTKAEKYIVIYQKYDSSYVDTMSHDVIKKFIEATHAEYKKRIDAEDFGKAMPGFFTDEPQYYRYATPYSNTFPKLFEEVYGYPVKKALPAMFYEYEGSQEMRYDYYLLCHKQFINSFVKQIYEWCEENGVQLTGHAVEEGSLDGQMWSVGGIMPFYKYEHIPGIDYLGRGISNDLAPKQLGSVCEQLGKKKAISEMFGCCGWDVTPRELKRIADVQYCGGVNLMCQHLYSYSIRGQRKRDYPCHYSEHNTWQKYIKEFNTYFARLGVALSSGSEMAPVLVLHPIRSAYLHYDRRFGGIKELESKLSKLISELCVHCIPYHFGDEDLLAEEAQVIGDKIKLGLCTYSAVVVPYCETIDKTTANLMREYAENGGKIFVYDRAPDRIDGRKADLSFIRSNITFEELKALSDIKISFEGNENTPIRHMFRNTDSGRLMYFANVTGNTYNDTEVTVKNCEGLYELDLNTLEYRALYGEKLADGSFKTKLDFFDSEAHLLMESKEKLCAEKPERVTEYIKLPAEFGFEKRPENAVVLDYVDYELENGEKDTHYPLMGIKDKLLRDRYKGKVTLNFRFDVKEIPERICLAVEDMKYTDFKVNGKDTALSGEPWLDRSFKTADITKLVRTGENTVSMSFDYFQRDYVYYVLYGGVSESLRNCLSFDCEIEHMYLYGNFDVRTDEAFGEEKDAEVCTGGFYIEKQKDNVDLRDPVKDGYAFFSGEMEAVSEFEWHKGCPESIKLGGHFAVCRVELNGHDLGVKLFDDRYENIGKFLKEGSNRIKIMLCVSRRNLLGPHHCTTAEPKQLGPDTFSGEKYWKGRECLGYTDRYAFVRFGIDGCGRK